MRASLDLTFARSVVDLCAFCEVDSNSLLALLNVAVQWSVVAAQWSVAWHNWSFSLMYFRLLANKFSHMGKKMENP